MSSEALIDKILSARRPGGWESVGDWEFYVEALTELDYRRIRAACVSYGVDADGDNVRKFDAHALALGWLDAITDWRGVKARDFVVPGLSEQEREAAIAFSPRLLRALLANRSTVLDDLVNRAMERHKSYIAAEAADAKN